nr:MAG TPA: hypothetical protein [Caudoviricetes sp.]
MEFRFWLFLNSKNSIFSSTFVFFHIHPHLFLSVFLSASTPASREFL